MLDIPAQLDRRVKEIKDAEFSFEVENDSKKCRINSDSPMYAEGAAAFFYKPEPWRKIIEELPDPLGYFQIMEKELAKGLTAETVDIVCRELNDRMKERGVHVGVLSMDRPPVGESVKVRVGNRLKTFDASRKNGQFLPGDGLISFESEEAYENRGLTNQRAITFHVPFKYDHTGLLLLVKSLPRDPVRELVTLTHELGHYEELQHEKTRDITFGGKTYFNRVPCTERTSALWGIKAGRTIWNATGNKDAIVKASFQAAIYNRVVGAK